MVEIGARQLIGDFKVLGGYWAKYELAGKLGAKVMTPVRILSTGKEHLAEKTVLF